jgi:UV damage endonuclease UvdE
MLPQNFRLGYACINTLLREQKPPVFTSRTLRLDTLKTKGLEYVKELAVQNVKDLLTILKWNKQNDIYFMRLSSEMFSFASHLEHGYSLDFADTLLKEVGIYANENGMRLTFHPGQYDVLSSPSETVILNTISDLNMHCDILDRMGMGKDSVMIIHGGGVYNDKEASLKRLKENILRLPEKTRNRLVLENCEMSYCLEDLLPISEELSIPIVIDTHHNAIYPSSQPIEFYYERVFKVWFDRGIKPKVHVSNSVPGILETDNKTMRRKHSDYIQFLHKPLYLIKFPIDIMLECKMKEKALLKLRTDASKQIGLRNVFLRKIENKKNIKDNVKSKQKNMEQLTKSISSLNTDYSEYEELKDNVNLKLAGYTELKLTRERYQRYLEGITIWDIDELNIDAWYIRDLIRIFVKETKVIIKSQEFLIKYLKMMKKIDRELKKVVDLIHENDDDITIIGDVEMEID